jgi:hypothetical protein
MAIDIFVGAKSEYSKSFFVRCKPFGGVAFGGTYRTKRAVCHFLVASMLMERKSIDALARKDRGSF